MTNRLDILLLYFLKGELAEFYFRRRQKSLFATVLNNMQNRDFLKNFKFSNVVK